MKISLKPSNEKNSNEEDVKPNVKSKYLNKINGIVDKTFGFGLITCALEQDSDGLYEYIKKHGGEFYLTTQTIRLTHRQKFFSASIN